MLVNKNENQRHYCRQFHLTLKKASAAANFAAEDSAPMALRKKLAFAALNLELKLELGKDFYKRKISDAQIAQKAAEILADFRAHPSKHKREMRISDCTFLFDQNSYTNEQKASFYVYSAFLGNLPPIDESLSAHISYVSLAQMLIFDRPEFAKIITTSVKKKIEISSKWQLVKLGDVAEIDYGTRIVKKDEQGGTYPVYGGGGETFKANSYNREDAFIISRFGMSSQCVRYVKGKFFLNDSGMTLNVTQNDLLIKKYLNFVLFINQNLIYLCGRGVVLKNIDIQEFKNIKIPLPPLEIQHKIVSKIEELEQQEESAKNEVEQLKKQISQIMQNAQNQNWQLVKIANIGEIYAGGDLYKLDYKKEKSEKYQYPIYSNGKDSTPYGFANSFQYPENSITVSGRGNIGDAYLRKEKFCAVVRLIVIIPNQSVVPRFAELSINKIKFENVGVTIPQLTVPKISNYTFPLPPLDIQQKIVSKIEDLEQQISAFSQTLEQILHQKEAVLKEFL